MPINSGPGAGSTPFVVLQDFTDHVADTTGVHGIADSSALVVGSTSELDGQNVENLRRPTLIIDRMFPSPQHDHAVVWVDESARVAYAVGQDQRFRKGIWSGVSGDESYAESFDWALSSAASGYLWANNGLFYRVPTTNTLLMDQSAIAGGTVLLRSINDGVTWSTVWTAPSTVLLLGPQSLARDATTGYLYLVEYAGTGTTAVEVVIYRSTDDGATWSAFKTMDRHDSADGAIRHWHSCRYDSVSARMYFLAGDQNNIAGIYRVNDDGDDIEAVVLNNMVTVSGVSYPARTVDVMFFPDYIAWANDGGGGDNGVQYVYRMARSEIGEASPAIEQVAAVNATGWWTQNASSDGSKWIVCASNEAVVGRIDTAVHLYAVTGNGSQVDEVAAFSMDSDSDSRSISGFGGGSGGGEFFWMRGYGYQRHPHTTWSGFQFRAKLAWGAVPVYVPPAFPNRQYGGASYNFYESLTAGQTLTVGHTRAPQRARRMIVTDIGCKVLSGSGAASIQLYNATTAAAIATVTSSTPNWRYTNDTSEYYISSNTVPAASDQIEIRLIETGGASACVASAFVTIAWGL